MARWGASAGLSAWVAYGVVEHFFLTFVEGWYRPSYVLASWHFGLTLFVFGVYACAGLALGGASGVLIHWWFGGRERVGAIQLATFVRAVALLTAAGAAVAYMALNAPRSGLTGLLFLIFLGFAAAVIAGASHRVVARLANSWTAALLFAPFYALKIGAVTDRITTVMVVFGGLGIVVTVSLVCAFPRPGRKVSLIALPIAIALVIAAGLTVDQRRWLKNQEETHKTPTRERPHVILIVMDAVRADHLSLYGYGRNTTPNLSRLAEDATLFTHAVAVSDYTLPSHASIFSGLYPSWHRARTTANGPAALDSEFVTLAEILAARGYSTAGISANYGHLSPAFGLTQGFQHWEAFAVLPFLQPKWFFSFRCALKPLLSRLVPERNLGWMEAPADYINRRVVSSLEKLQSARGPFFLFVNYMDAHHPYIAPRPFDALFHCNDLAFRWTQYDDLKRKVRETQRPPSQRLQQHLISKYDGSVAYLDSQLGALFKRLKNLGLYDRCLLIVTADHGETFGRRNLMGHVLSVYQDQVHVPLVIKYPGVRKKTVVNAFVSHVDLMPTILDAVGLPIPKGLQGRSLIRPELGEKRLLVAEHFEILRPRGLVSPTLLAERAMFDNALKLICSTDGKQELYDLSRDPDEYENLYRPNDPTVKRLEESLDRWVASAPKSVHRPAVSDRVTLERLKSLGYVQ